MAMLIEDTTGKIRNRPVHASLKRILTAAADLSGIDIVRITSGGQLSIADAKAQGAKIVPGTKKWKLPNGRIVRTGSTRHDNGKAADLLLEVGGRTQNFNSSSGRQFFEEFAEYSVALGSTGLGAGVSYMGERTMHVGFGNPAVWNSGAPALPWLVRAVARGKANPLDIDTIFPRPGGDMTGTGRYRVVTRSGLRLRGGPGTAFDIITVLEFGTVLEVVGRSGDWAKVDLVNDGAPDGFVHGAFLQAH